jgi:NTP pyrophosphatase (non-canonical NTP hydrolase)
MTVPTVPTISSTSGPKSLLTVQAYEIQARSTDQHADGASLAFTMLGLFGEIGSLLSEVKKKQRDKVSYEGYADAVVEELGDVLWYLTALASRAQLSVANIAFNVSRGYSDWHSGNVPDITFKVLQPSLSGTPSTPTSAFEKTLLKFPGEIGILVADYEAGRLIDHQAALAVRLMAVMRTLVQAADEAGVTLEAAAKANLRKIFDRWPLDRSYPPPLDESAPEPERLPRDLIIEVFEREVASKRYVFQRCNGINIGDRLTDNAMTPDDYRFHDVFHYAYAAVLTWSPVIRSLFRLKRKSNPEVDDAEDGARAALIEEGIATWIFGQAKLLDFFMDMKSGELPFGLLKHVRQFVSGYEAARCPLWLWEDAILQGYEAFRFLKEKRRSRVHIDVINRRLSIEDLPV